MVGQRIKVIEDNMAEFDVSSSMESSINEVGCKDSGSCRECPDDVG